MDTMRRLRDLLMYEVRNICSAEEQIIEALPSMIGKAANPALKGVLEQHLEVTKRQKDRLTSVKQMIGNMEESGESGGILETLFGPSDKCKGIEGLIEEGEKVMSVDMEPQVMDAAIIGVAQKIEHYEMAAYGTTRTYAEQLGMVDVAQLLQQTLLEEQDTDDQLTSLAVGNVNQRAVVGVTANS
ncbi:MAG: ferritin-like domain-containing protein [Candidatus Dadabacteria bacterium]